MWRLMALFPLAVASPLALSPAPVARADAEAHAVKRQCLSAAETRELIKAQHLREPFAVLKYAAQHFKAEALSAKLCRIEDELIYEIALLHRDGKFFHAHVNATTGKLFDYKRAVPAPPKT